MIDQATTMKNDVNVASQNFSNTLTIRIYILASTSSIPLVIIARSLFLLKSHTVWYQTEIEHMHCTIRDVGLHWESRESEQQAFWHRTMCTESTQA